MGCATGARRTAQELRNRLGLSTDTTPVVGWLVSDEADWACEQTIRANGAMF